jgi:GT2 family glycosyltransferase
MRISYAIPVCNEHNEINRLLSFLIQNKRNEDEIVVQCDQNNTTKEVYEVIAKFDSHIKVCQFRLNGNFADFKNNLKIKNLSNFQKYYFYKF